MKQYTLGIYEKAIPDSLTWRERLLVAKEAGYDFLEMSIDETDDRLSRLEWSSWERMQLVRDMYETGLPVRSICLSAHRKYPLGSHDPDVRARSLEIMDKTIQLASDIGVRIVMLAGYDVYYEESDKTTVKYFEENLKKSADMAASMGIILGFETMETPFMNTVEKAMHYVKLINSPYLGVYPDIGNVTNAVKTYGTEACDDLETGRGHLLAMHLKETVPGVFREVPYGTGHVDFDEAIAKAYELDIRRFVTEFWYKGEANWRDIVHEAVTMMRTKLDKVYGG